MSSELELAFERDEQLAATQAAARQSQKKDE